ncbi:ABC transporter permease [Cohnella lubricantis]|uniref:ABC transporter permease n=1 Tax=Cohnella lubricantis TaxID=2163172 RepID=UPI001AE93F9F|nr:ABC transporter permease [Cohnella lubricantis]MBP2120686.1 ABC-2 type transport system permease protein [Cohnella lubricantis]
MAELERARAERLRKQQGERAAAWRGEIYPYFRYVLQSGFGLVLGGIGITLVMGYIRMLREMPADWPSDIVGVACLTLIALYTPLRTYAQPADTVFALPLESAMMGSILRPQLRGAMITSALRMAAAFCVYAPIYARAPATAAEADARSLALLGLTLALLGAWNARAAWDERRIAAGGWRIGLRAARYAAVLLMTIGLLLRSYGLAALFTVVCAIALTLLARTRIRHAVPWDRLIVEEGASRRRWLRFLSWFVDVPSETQRPAKRAWIAWAADRLRWRRESAWTYLYAKTMLRSDTFGSFWRWNALLLIIILMAEQPIIDLIAYAIAVFVGCLQLTELGRLRFAEIAAVAPLPDDRRRSAAAIARTAGLIAATLLWLGAALPARPWQPAMWLIALAAGWLWAGWLLPRRLRRNRPEDDDV